MEKNIKEYKNIFSESNSDLVVKNFLDIDKIFYRENDNIDGGDYFNFSPYHLVYFSKDGEVLANLMVSTYSLNLPYNIMFTDSKVSNLFFLHKKHFVNAKKEKDLLCDIFLRDGSRIELQMKRIQ